MGKLRNLRELQLEANGSLKKLSESVGDLDKLEKLIITGQGITQFPESMEKLRNLRELDLGYHEDSFFHAELEKLPVDLWSLQSCSQNSSMETGSFRTGRDASG